MSDNNTATSLVVDSMQLVSMEEPATALMLLRDSELDPVEIQRTALHVMAWVMSGDGAAGRFAELRSQVLALAVDDAADEQTVVASLETVSAAEALAHGAPRRADAIVAGSTLTPITSAWTASSLTGQAIRGWLRAEDTKGFWRSIRDHFGVGGAR